jgi:hypothetical protein
MRFFGKSRRVPTDEERKRLARIVNPNQRIALLAAIQRGETIPDYAWTPFPDGIEDNPELLQFHEQLLKYAASSGRDMIEVIASLRPESHVQFYATKAGETASEDTGYLCATPLPVPDLVDDADQVTGILCWGNPWGPTLSFLALIGVPKHPESLLYLTQMNPFQCQNLVFGVVPDSIRDSYLDHILDEVLSKYSAGEFGLFSDSLPSFILPLTSRVHFVDLVRKGLAHVRSEVVERECALLRRIPCDPWALATELFSIEARMRRETLTGSQGQHQRLPIQQASPKSLDDWLWLVTDHDHFASFIGQFPHAWKGAIEHAPTRVSVMVWEDAERVLRKLWPETVGK